MLDVTQPQERVDEYVERLALDDYRPIPYRAPVAWLARAIDEARSYGRSGCLDGAREVMRTALSIPGHDKVFAEWRAHITWAEARNESNLRVLAWKWHELRKSHRTQAVENELERIEQFACANYGVDHLSTQRGWSERVCKQMHLLPPAWRNASCGSHQ
jgi:hypothetical protein